MDPSQYTEYRPLMFSIAYRMTGSVSDAEDIVQEAFLRAGKDAEVTSPKAYLATITTRLAIDHLRSARVRRESYVGTWLPEPLIATGSWDFRGLREESDPAELAETSDSLSMAFLVLLESLAPAERSPAGRSSPGPAAVSTRDGRDSRRPAPRARSSPPSSWPRPAAAT